MMDQIQRNKSFTNYDWFEGALKHRHATQYSSHTHAHKPRAEQYNCFRNPEPKHMIWMIFLKPT